MAFKQILAPLVCEFPPGILELGESVSPRRGGEPIEAGV